MCFAGSLRRRDVSIGTSDGTPAFEQDGLEWGTILGVDGAGPLTAPSLAQWGSR